jgi:membrane-anchored mycosin MYCP
MRGVHGRFRRRSAVSANHPGRLRRWALASVGAVAVLLFAETASFAYAAPRAAPADGGTVKLPALSPRLGSGESCAKASNRRAHARPWTVHALGLSHAWQLTRGAGVTVGVVDTGVSTDVPALDGRVDAAGGAGTDCVGHGSFAAGLIGAAPTEGVGFVGVAPQAHILAVRGTDRRGKPSASRVADGIRSTVDGGAKVVYVGQALTEGRAELTRAVRYARRHDALVVAPAAPDAVPDSAPGSASGSASGSNSGVAGGSSDDEQPAARPHFPAFAPGALSVEDVADGGDRPSGAPKVFAADLAAPGDAVVSVAPKGKGHYIGSGPSLAAANVAGAAALVRAYHPKMTAAQVYGQLILSATPSGRLVLDPYAAVATVTDKSARGPARSTARAQAIGPEPAAPRNRALAVAVAGGGTVALVAAAAVLVPLGRARGWRPAGRDPQLPPAGGAGGEGEPGRDTAQPEQSRTLHV